MFHQDFRNSHKLVLDSVLPQLGSLRSIWTGPHPRWAPRRLSTHSSTMLEAGTGSRWMFNLSFFFTCTKWNQVTTDSPHGVEVTWNMESNPVKVFFEKANLRNSLIQGWEAAPRGHEIHKTCANHNAFKGEFFIWISKVGKHIVYSIQIQPWILVQIISGTE